MLMHSPLSRKAWQRLVSAKPASRRRPVHTASHRVSYSGPIDDGRDLPNPALPPDPSDGPSAAEGKALSRQVQLSAEQVQDQAFKRTRRITFASFWLGYALFYVTRNCLNFVNPLMLQDASLKLSLTVIGGITSLLPVCYAFSKGFSGFVGSATSPKLLLSGGLAGTGLACLGFGLGNGASWFAAFWALNGCLQGLGAPACAKLLTQWFNNTERGTAWSIWTASNNVGAFAAPWIAGMAASNFGWRWGMWVPGFIAVAAACVLVFTITDKPTDKGFAPVEGKGSKQEESSEETKPSAQEEEEKPSIWEILKKDVLTNVWVWLFALSYFFVYFVRQGTSSWFVHYMMNVKGVEELSVAAAQVSGLEVGGFFGALSAGTLSDYFVRRAQANGSTAGRVGIRVRVVIAYAAFTAAAMLAFSVCPNIPPLQWAAIAAVGFGLYGPQMLIGLCGAESVRPDAVGATQGLLGWVSYIGAACAGAPLAMLVQKFGWSLYFSIMIVACLAGLALVVPMLTLKAYSQKEA